MDVARTFIVLLCSAGLLISCNKEEKSSVIFSKKSGFCMETAVKNRFIVLWKDGRITYETAKNKELFLKEFVQKNIENIKLVEYDYHIELVAPYEKILSKKNLIIDNWGAKDISAPFAWQQGLGGKGIIVAVIDTGADVNHPQLIHQIAYNDNEIPNNGIDDDANGYIDDYSGYNFINDSNDVIDNSMHGTHVSGIIAAEHSDTDIVTGYVQGIAPTTKILPLKFLDSNGGGLISGAIKAIDYAVSRGAKIINASWGGPSCSEALGAKINSLVEQDVLFVAAAGNNGNNLNQYPEFPAAFLFSSQITVGAITALKGMAGFSNYSWSCVQLFAPGAEIFSTTPNNSYTPLDGTSMAAPFVSGAAAVLWSYKPSASMMQIRQALLESTTYDQNYANVTQGRLNLKQALIYLSNMNLP